MLTFFTFFEKPVSKNVKVHVFLEFEKMRNLENADGGRPPSRNYQNVKNRHVD